MKTFIGMNEHIDLSNGNETVETKNVFKLRVYHTPTTKSKTHLCLMQISVFQLETVAEEDEPDLLHQQWKRWRNWSLNVLVGSMGASSLASRFNGSASDIIRFRLFF